MIETEGWKKADRELPKKGKLVLCCCPSDSTECFKLLTWEYCNLENKYYWERPDLNDYYEFNHVSRWMPIPLFGELDYKKPKISQTTIRDRFEIMDL